MIDLLNMPPNMQVSTYGAVGFADEYCLRQSDVSGTGEIVSVVADEKGCDVCVSVDEVAVWFTSNLAGSLDALRAE